MKVYGVSEFRDCRGIGSEDFFATEQEAVKYARDMWENLADVDKKSYINDEAAYFMVFEIEVPEGVDDVSVYDYLEEEGLTSEDLWTRDIIPCIWKEA